MRILVAIAALAAVLSAPAAEHSTPAAKAVAWLSSLPEQSVVLPRGRTFGEGGERGDGGRIAVQAVPDCSHSLSAHAPSRVVYQLGRRFHHLAGAGAIDGAAIGTKWKFPCVVFVILGDGKELWRSPRIGDHAAVPFAVDVAGVDLLELVAEAPTLPRDFELHRAIWVEPQLAQYGQRLIAAEQVFKRARAAEEDGSLAKAAASYEKAARDGGVERFAIDAEERAIALRERRRDDLAEAMTCLTRGDADAALEKLAWYRKAWGEDNGAKALAKQAREAKRTAR